MPKKRTIRVLVVDDSTLIREMICDFLAKTDEIEVVGQASDGQEAIEVFQACKPDVISLDIQMPVMNGLEALEAMLEIHPTPTIMVSSLTQCGATETFDALDRGALDYVAKPEMGSQLETVLGEELPRKIRAIAGSDVRQILKIRKDRASKLATNKRQAPSRSTLTSVSGEPLEACCIAIGISTGGPPALMSMFESLSSPLPPILIVQHMPMNFTTAFAWRMNSSSSLVIKEAETGDVLEPNHVYIAPGGSHLRLRTFNSKITCRIVDEEPVSGFRPSVDVMMKDAASHFGVRCLGVIMTGMGRDGSDGCGAIREAGGYVLGQDQESSDVYGMNKIALDEGNVDEQFHLDNAASLITSYAHRLRERTPVLAQ